MAKAKAMRFLQDKSLEEKHCKTSSNHQPLRLNDGSVHMKLQCQSMVEL